VEKREVKTYIVGFANEQSLTVVADSFDVNDGAYRFWRGAESVASCERARTIYVIEVKELPEGK